MDINKLPSEDQTASSRWPRGPRTPSPVALPSPRPLASQAPCGGSGVRRVTAVGMGSRPGTVGGPQARAMPIRTLRATGNAGQAGPGFHFLSSGPGGLVGSAVTL